MAFFTRIDATTFQPARYTGGAWNTQEQHIAPGMGLLAHVLELDRAARGSAFVAGRLSYDILGPIPIEPVTVDLAVVRPGRSVELVECTLFHKGRPALRLRAWLMQTRNTGAIAGTPYAPIAPPESMPAWTPSSVWAGEFISNVDIRRDFREPGRASFWVRARQPLLAGEAVGALARAATVFDVANGMAMRADPRVVAFPNLDLTVHLFGLPQGEWLGFDTSVSFGANGLGLTSSVIHDAQGPIGTAGQALTVRP